jgi:hypothetical protein
VEGGAGEEIEDFGFHDGSVLLELDGKEPGVDKREEKSVDESSILMMKKKESSGRKSDSPESLGRDGRSHATVVVEKDDPAQRKRLVTLFDSIEFELGQLPDRNELHER